MPKSSEILLAVHQELQVRSASTLAAYRSATAAMSQSFSGRQLARWATEGASLSPHSLEAATEYFRASPQIAAIFSPRRFFRWAYLGHALAEDSGTIAAAFFRASPSVLAQVPPEHLHAWVRLAKTLNQGNPASEALCRRFLEASPSLLQHVTVRRLKNLVLLLDLLGQQSYEMAVKVLEIGPALLAQLQGQELKQFLALASLLAEKNSRVAAAFCEAGLNVYSPLAPEHRTEFLELVVSLTGLPSQSLAVYLEEVAKALPPLSSDQKVSFLRLSSRVARLSPLAAGELLRSTPRLVAKLDQAQLERWSQEGERILVHHEESGLSYFGLRSSEAVDVLAELTAVVELSEIREVLRLYCKALMNKNIWVLATDQLTEQGASWTLLDEPVAEGSAIFVPSQVVAFDSKEGNFEAYKVLATHQAGHLEFGTFEFAFATHGTVFPTLRLRISEHFGQEDHHISDFERFFELFADRKLARDLFTTAEDARIDTTLKREYRGIRRPYQRMQQRALAQRHAVRSLPLREGLMELLIQASLEDSWVLELPAPLVEVVYLAAGLLRTVASSPMSTEDVAEATIRLYTLLHPIPNLPADAFPPEDLVTVDLSDALYDPTEEDTESLFAAFLAANARQPEPGSEPEYASAQRVEYRGELRPELVQAMLRLQQEASDQQEQDPEQKRRQDLAKLAEFLRGLLDAGDEDMEAGGMEAGGDAYYWPAILYSNLMRELRGVKDEASERLASLAAGLVEAEEHTFTYDEWDYVANAYRPNWCQVRQRNLKEGSGSQFEETLHQRRGLVSAVRRQFEMLRPENFGKVKRLLDGEDFDLDAVIEAVVEKAAKSTPSEKLYLRRKKVERSVSIAVLLDMSLSTDERIDDSLVYHPNPKEGEEVTTSPKRIIDIERESLVLLVEALEQIGDSYGIYGFSSAGRDNVQFYVIKEIGEPFSQKVKGRIDTITPVQGTRMGPAIRHAITKLERQEAKTKILMLISDGRPQDRDYGVTPWDPKAFLSGNFPLTEGLRMANIVDWQDWDEKEYAVHDTKMALTEARRKNIVPFCLSIDKVGHDYLREMCGDIGYEVVSDVEALPRRLPTLYRRLTT